MTRTRQSVVFAALLLVAQLLFAVTSGGATAHDGAQHCGGCPDTASSGMSHGMGAHDVTPGKDPSGSHCGTHCSHDSSNGAGNLGCGSGCAMVGGGHCGSPASLALTSAVSIGPVVRADSFRSDRRAVDLPDSPLFDFLRPPARG